jgi:hypothetical protein
MILVIVVAGRELSLTDAIAITTPRLTSAPRTLQLPNEMFITIYIIYVNIVLGIR